VTNCVRFDLPRPQRTGKNQIKGVILKIDKFGNCLTNFMPQDVPELFAAPPPSFRLVAGQKEITKVVSSYATGPTGEPFAILGSSDYLELAASRTSAAQLLGARRGMEISIFLGESPSPLP
jgi:S-adenosylmethionine hydrolase